MHPIVRRTVCALAFAAMTFCGATAQSPIRDIYIEATAVAEKCGAKPLDDAAAAKLAAVIAAETKEPTPPSDVVQLLAKARAAHSGAVDCDGPFTSIHVQFFNNVVRPRIDAQTSPPPAA